MKAQDAAIYLNYAKRLGIQPNFWLSEEYLRFQEDAHLVGNQFWTWVQEGDLAIFPPLPIRGGLGNMKGHPVIKIWSDFPNYSIGQPVEFLDWEYAYRSDDFTDLRGGQWAVFRKNIRKWPKAHPHYKYYTNPPEESQVRQLLVRWLEARFDVEIQDHESLSKFVFEGNRRAFLFNGDRLLGINVWDAYDAQYLMYRYCIADPEEPWLDEFLRYQFYMSVPHKIVLDGGTLGNEGLERFKDRLNPFRKRNIFTREWKGEYNGR